VVVVVVVIGSKVSWSVVVGHRYQIDKGVVTIVRRCYHSLAL